MGLLKRFPFCSNMFPAAPSADASKPQPDPENEIQLIWT
jgi:hypothetical protein